eukprot:TRINITY_DN13324_c0_g1_i1.p1 TRINITY_DN13324_c0_g1~~TRINITY_DN13324_c0_g1_i1.p1  ORF type:complete len:547 (-),score=81.80 TRINITY_DN13324_c0_g1_i1:582-2222(-)
MKTDPIPSLTPLESLSPGTTIFLSSSVVATLAVVFISLAAFFWSLSGINGGTKRSKLAHIPGPKRSNWLLGNFIEMAVKGYPAYHLECLLKYGRIFKMHFGPAIILVIGEPELVREILIRNFKNFNNRLIPPYVLKSGLKGLVFSKDAYWANVRRIVAPLFSPTQLRVFATIIDRHAQILSERIGRAASTGETFDVMAYTQALTLDVIGEAGFRKDFGMQRGEMSTYMTAVITAIKRTTELRPSVVTGLLLGSSLGRASFELWKWVPFLPDWRASVGQNYLTKQSAAIVAERRKDTAAAEYKDVVSQLTRAVHSDDSSKPALSNTEIGSIVGELIAAGSDTTANTLAFAIFLLATHPDAMRSVHQEIDRVCAQISGGEKGAGALKLSYDDIDKFAYIERVVKETLRLYPTGAVLVRTANSDCMVGSVMVPAGVSVFIPVYAMHHDPGLFPNPEAFRPERFDPECEEHKQRPPLAYLPFGDGPRMCIGYKLAMAEAVLGLVHMCRGFDFALDESVMGTGGKNMKLEAGIVLKPSPGVFVKATRRPVE